MCKSEYNEPWEFLQSTHVPFHLEINNCIDAHVISIGNRDEEDIRIFARIVACVNACKNIDTETLIKAANFQETRVLDMKIPSIGMTVQFFPFLKGCGCVSGNPVAAIVTFVYPENEFCVDLFIFNFPSPLQTGISSQVRNQNDRESELESYWRHIPE